MLSQSAQRVQDQLKRLGFEIQVQELPDSTRTSAEAARAVGCQIEQIVKSLVFKGEKSGQPVLILVSGANRVNEQAIEALLGETILKADPDFVRQQTGFVIGGVPPVGHTRKLRTFIDKDLLQHGSIWAAAGTPHAVFRLTPADLVKMTRGQVVDIL
jgi:Cys-tRNA(Pro) deacylase